MIFIYIFDLYLLCILLSSSYPGFQGTAWSSRSTYVDLNDAFPWTPFHSDWVIRYLLDMTEVRTMSWFRSYWMRRLIDSVMCWICLGNNSFRVHCWLSSVVSNGFDRPSSFDLKRMIILRLSYITIKKFTHLKISHFQNFVLISP